MTEPQLSARAREILAALLDANTWLDRNEIATAIGKNRLSPHDIGQLERLIGHGLVEQDSATAGIAQKYVYKAT